MGGAEAYYNELQQIPGFEVMPVGVAKQRALASKIEPHAIRQSDLHRQLVQLMDRLGDLRETSP